MNVRLAAQTLNNSAKEALTFLQMKNMLTSDATGIMEFCGILNDSLDIINCRKIYGNNYIKQPFKIPLNDENEP